MIAKLAKNVSLIHTAVQIVKMLVMDVYYVDVMPSVLLEVIMLYVHVSKVLSEMLKLVVSVLNAKLIQIVQSINCATRTLAGQFASLETLVEKRPFAHRKAIDQSATVNPATVEIHTINALSLITVEVHHVVPEHNVQIVKLVPIAHVPVAMSVTHTKKDVDLHLNVTQILIVLQAQNVYNPITNLNVEMFAVA